MTWLSPILYPDMPEKGHRYLRGFATWVYEYASPHVRGVAEQRSEVAAGLHEIHDTRLNCEMSRTRICEVWPGFWDPTPTANQPGGRPLDDVVKDAGAVARAYGAARMTYLDGGMVPAHVLIRPVEAAVARAVALQDVEAHLRRYPVATVEIDGVDVRAKRAGGEWVRTRKTHRPATPAEGASAILEKVTLEYVGRIDRMSEEYPHWRPSGFEAAALLLATAAELTGVPVAASTPPPVRYDGARLIATPELVDLIPALGGLTWCRRPEQVATVTARPAKPAGRAGQPRRRSERGAQGGGLSDDLRAMIPDFGGSAG